MLADSELRSGSFQSDIQSYELVTNQEGLYLVVHPLEAGEKPLVQSMLVGAIKKLHVKEINLALIIEALERSDGQPVKLVDFATDLIDPEINLLISRDRMEATLEIKLPDNAYPPAEETVLKKLADTGIVYGLHPDAIHSAIAHPEQKVVCARGTSAVDGENAYLLQRIDFTNLGKPIDMADDSGKMDLKNLQMFILVSEGDVLAEKVPATSGVDGTDVFGQPIPAKPGKDVAIQVGKNVRIEKNYVLAAISGHVQLVSGKFHVIPVIEIQEDVDYSTGNIDFSGSVIVKGSIQPGFTVKAEGDIDIYGTVSGGIVEGRNIAVRMGIQGMHKGYIKAQENVVAKFIENANVSAGKEVIVSGVILHSQISADRRIIVQGKKGLIAGGQLCASEEIIAKTAGTRLSVRTDLMVGVNPALRAEELELRKELQKASVSLDQAQKAMAVLGGMDYASLPEKKQSLFQNLDNAIMELMYRMDMMTHRIQEIEEVTKNLASARVKIVDAIYPGVKISIGPLSKAILDPLCLVAFYSINGEIRTEDWHPKNK